MSKFPVTLVSTLLISPALAAAQVGHDPARSPFRDIRNRTNLVATGWYVRGPGGLLDIGPTGGEMIGLRYEMRLSGPSDAFLGVSLGRFQRLVIDPDEPVATRTTGPVDQSMVLVNVGLSVILTGDKTWRGMAPYLGGAIGMGFGGDVASDTSGFGFNAKFVSGPHVGVRFYATRSISLRLEGRLLFWQLKYPDRFFLEPQRALGEAPVLDQASDPDSEWTSHPTLIFAVGYALRLCRVDFFAEGLRRGVRLLASGDAEVLGTALFSLRVALVATIVACLLGVPIGFMVGTTRFWGRRAAITALNTMLAFPTVVIGVLIWGLLARSGPLGGLGLLYTWWAIVIAEVLLAVPIAAALTAAAVQGIDPRVRRTALTLGAGAVQVHWVVAKEARHALWAAVVLAFGRVLAEVGAAMIVGGNIRHQTRTLTTAVALATSQGDFALAVALGLVLIALALTVNVLLQMLQARGDARRA